MKALGPARLFPIGAVLCAVAVCAAGEAQAPKLLDELYRDYQPQFENGAPTPLMKTSLQSTFYNRAFVVQDKRVNGLIEEGIKREREKDYRKAIEHYQRVIDQFGDSLIQVSEFGVFAPAALYVQQRILRFPPAELAFYRLNHDPQARDLFNAARERHAIAGLHQIAAFHRATSYGAKALFELGLHALDLGYCQEAADCFEQIRDWHPEGDVEPLALRFQLAMTYKLRGRKAEFDAVHKDLRARLKQSKDASKFDPAPLERLAPTQARTRETAVDVRARPFSFSSYTPAPAMAEALSHESGAWKVELPSAPSTSEDDEPSGGELIPFHNPTVAGHSVYYKHYNRIYCRSIVTGRLRWSFEVGPVDRDVTRLAEWRKGKGNRYLTLWYSDQGLVVDDARVYGSVCAYGRRDSLVALDRVTGEPVWAAGALRPRDEDDLTTRYNSAPATGLDSVFAPWSHDEGEGSDHLFTWVGVSALAKETGDLCWKVRLCQLSPTSTTQSKTGIRVLSSPPLVEEGVVYCATNAGVVAALDEVSGGVRWLTRYPHGMQRGRDDAFDGHDDISFFQHQYGPHFANHPPLLADEILVVTPSDSDHMLGLDRRTGQVRWSVHMPRGLFLAGRTRAGELVVAQSIPHTASYGEAAIELYDPKTGKQVWSFQPTFTTTWEYGGLNPGDVKTMRVLGCPVLTQDDRLYFSTMSSLPDSSGYHGGRNPAYAEWCLSLSERKLVDRRIFFMPIYRDTVECYLRKEAKNSKTHEKFLTMVPPQNFQSPFRFDPVRRLPFTFHGITVELNTHGEVLTGSYDRAALEQAASVGKTAAELFTRAELKVMEGRTDEALSLFEACRAAASLEDAQLVRTIDRELNRLYAGQAWQARLSDDREGFRKFGQQMAATATTVREEVKSLLALAEASERQGQPAAAMRILRNLVRNYAGIPVAVSGSIWLPAAESERMISDAVDTLAKQKPQDLNAPFAVFEKGLKRAAPAFFSVSAPVAPDLWVDADTLALRRLKELLARESGLKADFEKEAQEALGSGELPTRAHAMRSFPGTKAAQEVLDGLLAEAAKLPEAARRRRGYALYDLGRRLDLQLPAELLAQCRFEAPPRTRTPAPAGFASKSHVYEDASQVLRLALPNRGDAAPELLFVGGRQKKRLDNKFTLQCWDLGAWNPRWERSNIRLKGKGDEAGFEEAFVFGDVVVTHGKFDVLAFDLKSGEPRWRVQMPFDFDLHSACRAGPLLVLSGASNTLALQAESGEVAWNATEQGEPYAPAMLHGDTLVSIRREPFAIAFRHVATGRLLSALNLPDLSMETTHPVLDPSVSRGVIQEGVTSTQLPYAWRDGLLLVSDGRYYIAVDAGSMAVRWKRPIDDNDRLKAAPLRFSIQEPYVLVLKRDYGAPALHMLDSRTGALKWRTKEPDAVAYANLFSADGKSFTGICLPQAQGNAARMRRFDSETGKQLSNCELTDFEGPPDLDLLGGFEAHTVVLRAYCGEKQELFVVDVDAGKATHRSSMKAVGRYGAHGGKFVMLQGTSLIQMNSESIQADRP